jgi:tetratricopeptide (TPR) repeat protein
VDVALQAARAAIQTPLADVVREAGGTAAAELSFGQWCLPMLISSRPQTPLIDWDFAPRAVDGRNFKESLNTVSLPARFVGRRAEMRQYQSDLLAGRLTRLLITGAGGQGKTALAGKLALDLQKQGARVFAWSARDENPWGDFEFELELALDERNAKRYDHFRPRLADPAERAKFLLGLLTEQFGRVVLFLDNLETIQDPDSHSLTEPTVAAWIRSALTTPKLVLLATSRWDFPEWGGAAFPLARVNYGDFLRLAENFRLKVERERLRQVFDALGGNARGLEFFAAAVKDKNPKEEAAFLEAIAQTKADLQTNMAIAEIYAHLPAEAQTLLSRLPAYREPVPEEGILKLGLDLGRSDCQSDLLAVSLLEAQWNGDWQCWEYQPAPLVNDWLVESGRVENSLEWLNAAAEYHLYLLENERRTLAQAITAHHALRRAERHPEADRLTLDRIVGPLTLKGFYAALLTDWLPRICDSEDLKTRAEALGQTGKLLHHLGDFQNALPFMKQSLAIMQQIGDKAGEGTTLNNISQIYNAQGDYETALSYLKQSLAIRQQIGDKAGLCATLFNMGHIHRQNKQIQEAVSAWVTVYLIAKQINSYQALQALSKLAPSLGLPEGLDGWEMLAQKMQNAEGEMQNEGESELEQIRRFVRGLAAAVREKSDDAGKYFESVSKMAVDPEAPPELQALGKVLREYMAGVKNPDLSGLSAEVGEILKDEL